MTYATPTPYAAPAQLVDPTNVMGRRIAAYFIDVVLITAVAAVVGIVVWLGAATSFKNQPLNYCTNVAHPGQACLESNDTVYLASNSDTGRAIGVGALIWALAPLNAIVLQGITGATVGKHMLGLRVVRANGAIAGVGSILLRSVLFIVDNMCFAVVGLVTALATHPHRRVGDMAAGTFVVATGSVGHPIGAQSFAGYPPPYASPPAVTEPIYAPPPTASTSSWGAAPQTTDAGWGAPTTPMATPPVAEPSVAPPSTPPIGAAAPPAPSAPVTDPTEPHWDAPRNAWIAWEPTRRQWMQFDATTNQWRAM